jgi:hypothetical protein
MIFSGLAPLAVDEIADEGELIRVRARTTTGSVACPDCGGMSARVHAYHERFVDDVALDARRVLVAVRVRRLVCSTDGCRRTFREQVPGVLERYQRRTTRLAGQIGVVVTELAGRAGVRVLTAMAVTMSRQTAIRALRRVPAPMTQVPRVLGVDDFALRRSHQGFHSGLRIADCAEDVDDPVGEATAPAGVVVAATELPVGHHAARLDQPAVEGADIPEELAFFGARFKEEPTLGPTIGVGRRHVRAGDLAVLAGPPQCRGAGNDTAE